MDNHPLGLCDLQHLKYLPVFSSTESNIIKGKKFGKCLKGPSGDVRRGEQAIATFVSGTKIQKKRKRNKCFQFIPINTLKYSIDVTVLSSY